jgi:hydrogenase expression/formation protein HypD
MMRVPGSSGRSLQQLRAEGADIRIISSADQAADFARQEPQRDTILMGIGFETTTPTVASAVMSWKKRCMQTVFLFSVHKRVPPALKALLQNTELGIDGFICPGHVSTITGTAAYTDMILAGRAAVITGFEPSDILQGILMILRQIAAGRPEVEIQYSRGVAVNGNPRARQIMAEVFSPADAEWRGLGIIPDSGLVLCSDFSEFDAVKRYAVPPLKSAEPRGCRCGEILKGLYEPADCPLFKKACTPSNPVGPCMVSSEGTCAAHFKYG